VPHGLIVAAKQALSIGPGADRRCGKPAAPDKVWDVNRRAVAFYERQGFSVSASIDDPQTGLQKLVMQKELSASPG
jgi:hypothetical protein